MQLRDCGVIAKDYAVLAVRRLLFGTDLPTKPGLEPVYQRLFERDIHSAGLADVFYPVGPAANYSLLYLLLRVLRDLRPASVLELGAGQTSILLDQVRKAGVASAEIMTVEHDPFWADHVRSQVSHPIHQLDLTYST